ncbi:hypothetical protein NKH77_32250 [Streptomyces sp. M19]
MGPTTPRGEPPRRAPRAENPCSRAGGGTPTTTPPRRGGVPPAPVRGHRQPVRRGGPGRWPGVLLATAACLALLWRRGRPGHVVAFTAVCGAVSGGLGYRISPCCCSRSSSRSTR